MKKSRYQIGFLVGILVLVQVIAVSIADHDLPCSWGGRVKINDADADGTLVVPYDSSDYSLMSDYLNPAYNTTPDFGYYTIDVNTDSNPYVFFKVRNMPADQMPSLWWEGHMYEFFDLTVTDSDNDTFSVGYPGYTGSDKDCDDLNPNINPGAAEICDNKDNDCDGSVDESLTQSCGTGVCAGTQTCTAGNWGDCSTKDNDAGVCAVCDKDGIPVYDGTQNNDCDCPDKCTDNNLDGIIDAWNEYKGECQSIYTCEACGLNITEPDGRCKTVMKIPLEKGIDMFSLPLVPETDKKFSDVQNNCSFDPITNGTGIAYWDPLKAGTDKYVYLDANAILYPGQGYFTYQLNDCDFTIEGYKFNMDYVGYLGTGNIYSGWNIIGAPSDKVNDFGTVEGTCIVNSGPWGFDTDKSQYVRTQVLEPGKGYYIKTSNNCNLG